LAYTPPVSGEQESARDVLTRRAGIVGAAILGSRILGLIREQIFAVVFGAGRELDAFITAFRIPNLLRDLFAEGALSAAFVTTFSQTLARDGEARAWRLAALVINALGIVVSLCVIAGIAAAPAIVAWIAPGFAAIPGKTALAVEMTRIMFPFILMVALAAVVMGILNTKNVFGIPASASSFFNLGSILGGLGCAYLLAPEFVRSGIGLEARPGVLGPGSDAAARAIVGMAVGTLIGGMLQLAVQLPALRRVGFRYRVAFDLADPGLRRVLTLMAPATIGAAAVQVNVLVNNNFASYLGDGPVSWLNVAFRFMQLPIGVFGVAVSFVSLPALSRHAARADHGAMRTTLADALEFAFLFSIPAAVGLTVLGRPIIGLIYEHGRFTPGDTAAAAGALAAYAAGLAGYAGVKIVAPAFYALGDARTPMRISVVSIAVNYTLNWLLVRVLHFGHVGLALSTATVASVNFVWLFLILRGRIGGLEGTRLAGTAGRILVSAAVMAAVVAAAEFALSPGGDGAPGQSPTVNYALRVGVGTGLGVIVFGAGCWLLGVGGPVLSLLRGRRRHGPGAPRRGSGS
jgi:putative peptidoglycan lipid II flippase